MIPAGFGGFEQLAGRIQATDPAGICNASDLGQIDSADRCGQFRIFGNQRQQFVIAAAELQRPALPVVRKCLGQRGRRRQPTWRT